MSGRRGRPKDAPAEAGHIVGGFSALARVFMFATWAKIAVDHFNSGNAKTQPDAAYHDYLVTVTASAFSIEAFKRDLPLARPPGKPTCSLGKGGAAHGIWEALSHNFTLTKAHADWHLRLHDLFDLRDNVVHYMGSMQPLYEHPNGTYYQPMVGVYDEAAARQAVELSRDIMLHCLDHIAPTSAELTQFVSQHIQGSKGVDALTSLM